MRFVLIGPVYPFRGGIAHYTTRLYRELVEQGHQVSLVSFMRQYPRWLFPGRTDHDPSVVKLEVKSEYQLDALNPFSWWAIARAIRLERPDVLILQWWVPFFAPIWLLLTRIARRAGIKVIFICHNVLPHEQHPWDVWVARWTLKKGDGYIVQSHDERDKLLALLPGRCVAVVPMPIFDMFADQSVSKDEARWLLGLPVDAPVLMFFGFVREYKGLRHLLDAMSLIGKKLSSIRLLIVGEFWQDKRSYIEQIERLGIEQSVIIVDRYIPNEELPAYFAAADVVVLPYSHVTQSAVVQLAFGFGLPVITTRVGGLPDLVTEGETGLLVTPDDPDSLAAAIFRFFGDGLSKEMRASVCAARKTFTWERVIRVIEELAQIE